MREDVLSVAPEEELSGLGFEVTGGKLQALSMSRTAPRNGMIVFIISSRGMNESHSILVISKDLMEHEYMHWHW